MKLIIFVSLTVCTILLAVAVLEPQPETVDLLDGWTVGIPPEDVDSVALWMNNLEPEAAVVVVLEGRIFERVNGYAVLSDRGVPTMWRRIP